MPKMAPEPLYTHILKNVLDLEDEEITKLVTKIIRKPNHLKTLKIKTVKKWHEADILDDILYQKLESFLMFLKVKKPTDETLLAMKMKLGEIFI